MVITSHASGTFDLKLTTQDPDPNRQDITHGRLLFDKQFHGDLEGTSKGEMLSTVSEVKGSAGYVALERVTGKLHGRNGAFMLQHSGSMVRGESQLAVSVVPDSGTGELKGLAGKFSIHVVGGKHLYDFDYTISDQP